MAIALRGASSGGGTLTSNGTFTLPVTTNAGDCIIVAACNLGTSNGRFSGAGATWIGPYINSTAPAAYIWVGYNCSAGHTTFSEDSASLAGTLVWAVFAGVTSSSSPHFGDYNKTIASPPTTISSITYSPGDLLVAANGAYNVASWSSDSYSGTSSSLLDDVTASSIRCVYLSYSVPSTGSSLTYTSTNLVQQIIQKLLLLYLLPHLLLLILTFSH